MRTQRMYNPRARGPEFEPVAPALVGSRGGPIVVLHNQKPNARALMMLLAQTLARASGLGPVEVTHKRSASEPAPDELLERIAENAGVVLTGTAD